MRILLLSLIPVLLLNAQPGLRVKVRSRAELFKGSGDWQATESPLALDPGRTAVIICDMWDKHWCRGASQRVDGLVARMAATLDRARQRGITIIHAPSDTMSFYEHSPQRAAMLRLEKVPLPAAKEMPLTPLPIDDSDGGCDTPGDKTFKAWTRQHAGIPVAATDLISDKGEEVYSALRLRGITHLLVMGVHTNMCILNRTFAIKQMTKWGVKCILVRDLTDAMYDPADKPYVSHERGTELVIEHIEQQWCPSMLSAEIR